MIIFPKLSHIALQVECVRPCSLIKNDTASYSCFFLLLSATRVTVLLLLRSCDLLCIGTEGGGVYFLELPCLSLKDSETLLQDQVTQR